MTSKALPMILLLLFSAKLLVADKRVLLGEIKKPSQIFIFQDRFFITEDAFIYIYSLQNFLLIKKVGGAGEGPKQFKMNSFGPGLQLFPKGNNLVVNSDGRISEITAGGDFLKETRVKPFSLFIPVGENYVGNASEIDKEHHMWLSLHIYDHNLTKIQTIHRTDKTIGTGLYSNLLFSTISLPYESFIFPVYNEKIYIPMEKENELEIKIYNKTGTLCQTIQHVIIPTLKVSEDYKKKMIHWFRDLSPLKSAWETIKGSIIFKTHFPLFKNILVDQNLIYILTYNQKNEKHECIILNIKGKKVKSIWLALPAEEPFAPVCYTIHNGLFYALHENENTENWELQITALQ